MKKWVSYLNDFWFEPASPHLLGILRITTGMFSLWYLLTRYEMLQKLFHTGKSPFEPTGMAFFLERPLPASWMDIVLMVTIGLGVLYTIGWKFTLTGPFFALLLLFFMSYRNSWSMIYHNYNALVLHVLIIGFSDAAKAFSLDNWKNKNGNWREAPHWNFGWPVKLICTVTVGTYVLSGLAKLLGDLALEWATGEAMRSQVAVDAIRKEMLAGGATPLFESIYSYSSVFFAMGILTYLLELGAPAVFFNKWIALVWVLLTWSMHWGIFFIMGIDFPYHTSGLIFLPFLTLMAIQKIAFVGNKSKIPQCANS